MPRQTARTQPDNRSSETPDLDHTPRHQTRTSSGTDTPAQNPKTRFGGDGIEEEPTFDRDGYPTDQTLLTIAQWDTQSLRDFERVMDFAGRAWHMTYGHWRKWPAWRAKGDIRPVLRYVFSTGGWSGNESIVAALESNLMIHIVGPYQWTRGGHYDYRFPISDD